METKQTFNRAMLSHGLCTGIVHHEELHPSCSWHVGDFIHLPDPAFMTSALRKTKAKSESCKINCSNRAYSALNDGSITLLDNYTSDDGIMHLCGHSEYACDGKATEFDWDTDGVSVRTNLQTADIPNGSVIFGTSDEDVTVGDMMFFRYMVYYPFALYYAPASAATRDYGVKYERGTLTLGDISVFNDEMYYLAYQNTFAVKSAPGVTLVTGCDLSKTAMTGKMGSEEAITPSVTYENSYLPWLNKDAVAPHDFSVESALKGLYRLNYIPSGEITLNGEKIPHNFYHDILPLSNLEGYVDNPTFRKVMRKMAFYLETLFRTKGISPEVNECAPTVWQRVFADPDCAKAFSPKANLILSGDPGTGKTSVLTAVAAAFGIPIYICRLSEMSETDELTQTTTVGQRGFEVAKSICYWYTKLGGIFVLDDVTNANPNTVFTAIGGLMENPYEYTVGTEKVSRSSLSFMFATSNVGTQGSHDQNEALLTRFSSTLVVTPLEKSKFIDTITTAVIERTHTTQKQSDVKKIAEWTYDVYSKIYNRVHDDSTDECKLLSLRAAISLAQDIVEAKEAGFKLTEEDVQELINDDIVNIFYHVNPDTLTKLHEVVKSINVSKVTK